MFLDAGYLVYIVDLTSVGRGTQEDLTSYPLRISSTSNISEIGFTNPQAADAYPQSQLRAQWPGAGVRDDAVFDAFESSFMPLTSNTRQELSMRAAGCELLGLIERRFLVSHSIDAIHPILLSDECPKLVAGNVNLEPGNIPFESYVGNATSSVGRTSVRPFGLTVTNLNYDPPMSNYTDLVLRLSERTPLRIVLASGRALRRIPSTSFPMLRRFCMSRLRDRLVRMLLTSKWPPSRKRAWS
jgi:hypothetical protein